MKPLFPVAALAALLLSGCNLDNMTPKLTNDITELGKAIKATDQKIADTTQKITDVDRQIKATQQGTIDKLEEQKRQASEFVFGANLANGTNTAPNLYTRHIGTELFHAATILGAPTQQSVIDANHRLELLLSQKEQDLAELKVRYSEKEKQIADTQTALATNKTALDTLNKDHDSLVGERDKYSQSSSSLKDQRDEKEKQLIGKQQDDLRHAEDVKALKKQLVAYLTIAGIVAALGGAVAFRFYPPVVLPLGIASAVLFTAAYLVTQITKWELLGILALAGGALAIAAYIKYRRTAQIADNSIGATQELKNRAIDGDPAALKAYGEMRKHLVDWFGESGHDLEAELQSHLRRLNLIGKVPQPSLLPQLTANAQSSTGTPSKT